MLPPEITQLRNTEDKFKISPEATPGDIIIANEISLKQGCFELGRSCARKDGSTFYANKMFTPLHYDDQNLFSYAKVTKDLITEQKTTGDLRYMATIEKNIQDPVISSDNDALITRWNDAAEKLLGWKSEEVIGKNIDNVLNVYYPNETRTEIIISLQKSSCWKGELVYYTKTHIPVYVLVTMLQIKNSKEVIAGTTNLAQNITEKKKVIDRLIKQ